MDDSNAQPLEHGHPEAKPSAENPKFGHSGYRIPCRIAIRFVKFFALRELIDKPLDPKFHQSG